MPSIVGAIRSLALIILTVKKRAFTLPAALVAGAILMTASLTAGYPGIFIVLAAYGTIFIVDVIIGKKSEKVTCDINKKSGARGVSQVLVNAAAAVLALILKIILGGDEWVVVYAVALTECLADSLASDVGVLSKKDPIDLCRFRRIKRGLSGGVSLLGTLAALSGCAFMSLFTTVFFGFVPKYFLSILLIPMLGMLIDSALGSLVQAKFTCDVCGKLTEKPTHCEKPSRLTGGIRFITNNTVNLISSLLSTVTAVLVLIIL